ncbi:MAG: hypothetical protein F6K65_25345 [Moorea sp. SIO3C2]|nr:hypothetical protein [Moorena sp. SIO3C2]
MSKLSHQYSDFNNSYAQDIEQVLGMLSKITSRSVAEIKPHLDALLNRLNQEKDDSASASFYETSTHEEWSAEFQAWVDSHQSLDIPVLSDEAMSRESIYPDRF